MNVKTLISLLEGMGETSESREVVADAFVPMTDVLDSGGSNGAGKNTLFELLGLRLVMGRVVIELGEKIE